MAEAQSVSPVNNLFRRLLDNDEDEPPLISRGELCLITPTPGGGEIPAIWHEQPVIVFNPGIIEKIALRDETAYDPNDPYKSFWEYRPTPTTSHVVYDGEPLQSERIYSVDIYLDADDESPTTFPIFQLLSEDSRQQIATELALQTTPKNNNDLPTEDWTAIQQADYFIERGLRLDAIQALFNVDSPSPELATMQQQMIESVCSQD
ncbi:MAG: hypothetical protein AAGF93_21395 [Cyanobacteria bacterium P01_H01_bin.105]